MSYTSLKERLQKSLERTRESLSFSWSGEKPDWDALEESLISADVGVAATTEILDRLKAHRGDVEQGLRDELLRILSETQTPIRNGDRPHVIMLVGVNGVGKTTTVAKLAELRREQGRSVILVAADTFRAAAQEQLTTWGERVGAEVVEGEPGRDPASIVHDGLQAAVARGVDDVLIDTAGRLHTKKPLMDELSKIDRVAKRVLPDAPHETLLVMDATVGSNGLVQARQFREVLPLTGIVLTKMDGSARGGIVIAVARELGLPVRYTGVGESSSDLLPFEPRDFVDALLGGS